MTDERDLEDLEDLETLRKRVRGGDRSVAARRAREARVMSYAERRRRNKAQRTEQTNIKLTPADKKRLLAMCEQRGITMTEFLEWALDELEGKADEECNAT